ncbi:hypothetical protein M0R45_034176 [Rubus argutus]|uniref:Uncharacterized protein n=1 Tax=Rubus argutus TaxID=59490 RepID=A0AAW1VR69_RUBAR
MSASFHFFRPHLIHDFKSQFNLEILGLKLLVPGNYFDEGHLESLSAPNVTTLTQKTSPDSNLSKLKVFSILGTCGPHVLVVGGGHDRPTVVRWRTRVSPVAS